MFYWNGGHYPEWDKHHPIHFVGHSAGAQVVRTLQQMLADKNFKGCKNTSENWVLRITSLSGAFNGTTITYLEGMQTEDGRSLKPICLLQLLLLGVIIYDWLDILLWLKTYYNIGFDHYNLTWRRVGVSGLKDCLLGNSGMPYNLDMFSVKHHWLLEVLFRVLNYFSMSPRFLMFLYVF